MKNLEFYKHYKGVIKNAKHHAPVVIDVLQPMALSIISLADENSIISARKSKYVDGFTNPIKFRINGVPFYTAYTHEKGKVLVRKKNSIGEILYEFDNTNANCVMDAMEKL